MRRLTTPTQNFSIPIDFSEVGVLQITYKQNGKIVLSKYTDEITGEGTRISVRLSQEETKKFAEGTAQAQIRLLSLTGECYGSSFIPITVKGSLDERVLKLDGN